MKKKLKQIAMALKRRKRQLKQQQRRKKQRLPQEKQQEKSPSKTRRRVKAELQANCEQATGFAWRPRAAASLRHGLSMRAPGRPWRADCCLACHQPAAPNQEAALVGLSSSCQGLRYLRRPRRLAPEFYRIDAAARLAAVCEKGINEKTDVRFASIIHSF